MTNPQFPAENQEQGVSLQGNPALETKFRKVIGWFFWIAGLSLVNTISFLSGANIAFVIGLGATQVVDALTGALATRMVESATLIRVIGVAINLVIAGLFVLFGFLGRKRNRGMIIAGMVLYLADAVLMAVFKDFLAVAFHAIALGAIWGGLKALNQLGALDRPPAGEGVGTLG